MAKLRLSEGFLAAVRAEMARLGIREIKPLAELIARSLGDPDAHLEYRESVDLTDAGVVAGLRVQGMSKDEIDACKRLKIDPISFLAAGAGNLEDYRRRLRELRGAA